MPRSLMAPLLTALLLSACGTPSSSTPEASSPERVLTLHPAVTESDAQLEARTGGRIIVRTGTFTLIGLGNGTGSLTALSKNGGKVENNRKVLRIDRGRPGQQQKDQVEMLANGQLSYWANGQLSYWANGQLSYWANGQYGALPQNTQAWKQIGLDVAQSSLSKLGASVVVAVLDTGVDLAHPAFEGAWTDASTWKDFVDGDATPQEQGRLGSGEVGHGSEVAGLVRQIAPRARLMPLRVLDQEGNGDVAGVTSAIVWAADHGAQVINLSLGSQERVEAVRQAVLYANSRGVLVVAAAGNSGAEGLDYPAADFTGNAHNVAVGSVNVMDEKSGFSRYGAALSLLAPGENLYGPAPEGQMGAWSGTSMSAPVVAGALALGLAERPDASTVVSSLVHSARNIDTVAGNAEYAGKLGQGRLNLAAFVEQLRP